MRTVSLLFASLVSVLAAVAPPALAAPCGDTTGAGGTDVACGCGDTVTTDTVLDATDPVTTSVCPCDGLVVLFNASLDLGERTITGSGTCVGISISGARSVGGGRVARFGTGIAEIAEGLDLRLHGLQVVDNSDGGIHLVGARNVVEDCLVSRNGGPGIILNPGNDPPGGGVIQRCRVEDNEGVGIRAGLRGIAVRSNVVRRNGGVGITVSGSGNTVTLNRVEDNEHGLFVSADDVFGPTSVARNVALGNLGDGVTIEGPGVLVDRNRSHYNGGAGFDIRGTGHTVTLNIAGSNGEDGYTVSAVEAAFQRNTAQDNGRAVHGQPPDGYGVRDTTAGSGTGGTANTYSANRCSGNGLGDSSPLGLCF